MTDKTVCPTRLIDDVPAQYDAFSSNDQLGPHRRVAEAIAELIESSEQGGKVIGLEGGWGAGKSTVINLLRSRFKQNEKHALIAFDAWAHEGDPLRRTYLETLIRQLQDEKWIDKNEWDKHLEEIANRRRETSVRTVPKATGLGTVFAISVLFVPLGSALITSALRDGVYFEWGLRPHWLFIIGAILTVAPLAVLLGNLVRICYKRIRKIPAAPDESEWAIVLSNAITETLTQTTEAPNPTSIEFEDRFAQLMRDALNNQTGRRLLLVLDNLDRVDPDSALEIWSTLQTFLQDRQHRNTDWFRRLWIVVPFDPVGIRRLWETRQGGIATEQSAQVVSDSFLDKSFQVRFRVPPPVLSDWKSYLDGLITEALPEHGQEDRHLIYRVFDQCRTRNGLPPTPRELKLFVNQIGSVHRQWQHTFPLAHIAYFVLCCRESESLIEHLKSNRIPSENAIRILGEDLRANLAGLVFNVTADKGLELLLGEPIHQALTSVDAEALVTIAGRNGDGFWAVLEAVAYSKFVGLDGMTSTKIAHTLHKSKLLEANQRSEKVTILSCIRQAILSANGWQPFDMQFAGGICSTLELLNNVDDSRHVLHEVIGAFDTPNDDSRRASIPHEEYVDASLMMLDTAIALGHSDAIPGVITLPLDAGGWHAACQRLAARDNKANYWNRIRPKTEFADISTLIEAEVTAGSFSDQHVVTLFVTNKSPIGSSVKSVATAMRQRLEGTNNIPSAEAYKLLTGLWELKALRPDDCTRLMKQLATGGHLLHHYQRAASDGNKECQAMILLSYLIEKSDGGKPPTVGNSDAGHTQMLADFGSNDETLSGFFVKLLKKHGSLDLIFKVIDARSSYDALMVQCLKHQEANEVLTAETIVSRWPELRDSFATTEDDGGFTAMVGSKAQESNLCGLLQEASDGFTEAKVPLYSAIVNGANGIEQFVEWCVKSLEGLDREHWDGDLAGKLTYVDLALVLIDKRATLSFSTSFADALNHHGLLVAKGEAQVPARISQHWSKILDCFREHGTRKVLSERIVKSVLPLDGRIGSLFFELYGNLISDVGCLTAQEDIVSQLFSPLIRERNVIGVRWMQDVFKANPEFLKSVAAEHTVQEFQDRLRDCLLKPEDDEVQPMIVEIAAICQIAAEVPHEEGATVDPPTET